LLVFLSILSFCYSLPLFTLGEQKFGLRNIPGLKTFFITLVWTMSCVLLPILEAQDLHLADIAMRDVPFMIAKRFLLIFALAIPFDIRDLFSDRQAGLKTIPLPGAKKTPTCFASCCLQAISCCYSFFRNNGFNVDFFALTATAILMGWLIFKSKWEKMNTTISFI
jgi:4-hydroxybenzoate polyprenyltransferase